MLKFLLVLNVFVHLVGFYEFELSGILGGGASRPSVTIFTMALHPKARELLYPRTQDVKRFPVPDDKVKWEVEFPDYKPKEYTAPSVKNKPVWADPDYKHLEEEEEKTVRKPKWNERDGVINRKSHVKKYVIVDNVPRNPIGRTGLEGRGLLGRWGPNHAADPIVTRWKRNATTGEILTENGKPILEFIAVQRKDNQQWALPGGMVDAGEVITMTLKREFGEEALNSLEATDDKKTHIKKAISSLFDHGSAEIYRGYVDDPRNTDNSWMETVAVNFHDDTGESVSNFALNAGDDAVGVKWMDISEELELYASHRDFLHQTVLMRGARWKKDIRM